jgi:hypothetical protein
LDNIGGSIRELLSGTVIKVKQTRSGLVQLGTQIARGIVCASFSVKSCHFLEANGYMGGRPLLVLSFCQHLGRGECANPKSQRVLEKNRV